MLGIVVAAAGAGRRFGGEKILTPVHGRPLILWTLSRLARISGAQERVLVLPADRCAEIRKALGPALEALGFACLVAGGERRQDSVMNGVRALPPEVDTVLVHDAVRPNFSLKAAEHAVALAERLGAAIVGVPARDTLKRADSEPFVVETVPREEIWQAETPQVILREVLEEAFEQAERDGFTATDEASLVEHLGRPVALVRGEPWNVKVTEAEDVAVVAALLGGKE